MRNPHTITPLPKTLHKHPRYSYKPVKRQRVLRLDVDVVAAVSLIPGVLDLPGPVGWLLLHQALHAGRWPHSLPGGSPLSPSIVNINSGCWTEMDRVSIWGLAISILQSRYQLPTRTIHKEYD